MSDTIIKNSNLVNNTYNVKSNNKNIDVRTMNAAKEFEKAFLTQFIDMTTKTSIPETFGGGFAEETYNSFLSEAIAEQIIQRGGVGITEDVYNKLIKEQGYK